MERKKNHRQIEFQYEFDRLWEQKLEQVYDILLSKLMQDYEKDMRKMVPGGKKQ